jgi:HSP20 family protein
VDLTGPILGRLYEEASDMAIVRWEPARELASMEIDRLNRMFANLYGGNFGHSWMPPVDIYETENREMVLKAELPEMNREDIDITFENQVLTIRGERKVDDNVRRNSYQRFERAYGTFSRSFTIPSTVDPSGINATYKNGVLTVRLPQREEAKPKQIAVGE